MISVSSAEISYVSKNRSDFVSGNPIHILCCPMQLCFVLQTKALGTSKGETSSDLLPLRKPFPKGAL